MSYCPRPSKKTKTNYGVAATKTVNAPPPRTEACGAATSTVVGGGGSSTTNTVYVAGLAGPAGPKGDNGIQGWGFKWEGPFALNTAYKKQSVTNPLSSVVSYAGSTYIAILDNTSTDQDNPEHEPSSSPSWSLVAQKGTAGAGSLTGADKGFFDTLKDNVFDWIKNASIGDLLLAGAGVVGVVWAGSKIISAITESGAGDGNADSRYNGTAGLVTTAFVAPDIKAVITALCAAADNVTVDVSALPNEPCQFVIGQITSIRDILDQLSLAYQFQMVDTGGVLKCVPRGVTPVKTLTFADIGFAEESNGVPPAPYTTKRYQGIMLPKRVTIQYSAEDLDYNAFTQSTELYTFDEGQIVNLSVPVTLSHAKAKLITEVALVNAHLQRMQYSFKTSYKHIDLECADVVDTPFGAIRIDTLGESSEGLLEFTATDAGVPSANDGSNLGVKLPPVSTNIPVVIGYSQGMFIDPPVMDSNDVGVRLYAAVHGYDVAGWPGADIYVSENNGTTYDLLTSTTRESTIGLVEVITPTHGYHSWDDDTQIVVKVKTNSLASVTDVDVFAGKNWCMIGQEMLAFANATLIGEKTYRLTRLLRGRQGTEQFVSTHVANELFVVLDETLVRLDWQNEDRLTTKKYKVVTRGSSLDKVAGEDVFMVSNNTLAWTVLNAKVTKIGADFQFSWKGRARYDNALRDLSTSGNDADWAGYGVVIYASDGVTVKRREVVTGETFTYTAAMQTTDFGAVQATIKGAVAQITRDYGAGYSVPVNT